MKKNLLVVVSLLLSAPAFANPGDPELVNLIPSQVYMPTGFDHNDNSQVVIRGEFSNTCYKVGPTQVEVDPASGKVSIKNQAYFYGGCFCFYVLVPYDKVVDLGMLAPGDHALSFSDDDGKTEVLGNISVATAKPGAGPDDFLYLPASEMTVLKTPGQPQVELRGEYTNTCMVHKETRIVRNRKDVVEILPVAEMLTRDDCQNARVPFVIKAQLPKDLKGKVLVHARALSGKSLNLLADF
ncbi:MAG: hypothetical protein AB7P04_12380 [Bacteriovoracia bacterium]